MTGLHPRLTVAIAALALGCSSKKPSPEVQAEATMREAFARAAAEDAGSGLARLVSSRNDVLFDEGFGVVSYDPPNDYRNPPFRWFGQRSHVRLHEHAGHAMSLELRGWLNEDVIRSKAVVTLYLNGVRLFDTGPVEKNHWTANYVVPAAMLRTGWNDLVITLSAVGFHWSDPPTLAVAVLNSLEWSEIP